MRLGRTNSHLGKPPSRAIAVIPLFAQEPQETEFFLGDDLLPFLTLAIGAALLLGTAAAFIRPPSNPNDGALERPPILRSLIQMAIGLIATVWALATLLA